MANTVAKKVWTNEETLELICKYESFPEIWDSRHTHYRQGQKKHVLAIDGEAMNTSVEVQRKIHNLRNQVSNCFTYYTACIVAFV